MKKLLIGALSLLTVITGLYFTSCSNSVSDSKSDDGSKSDVDLNLQGLINNANENVVLDLESKVFDTNVTVRKALTIKNADLGGKTITVKSQGVTLKNISNAKIIVGSEVADGDFTLEGCTTGIEQITVYGGGNESIHINNSSVKAVSVVKTKVRIALEGSTKIESMEVKSEGAKIDGESNTTIKKISVSSACSVIFISGGTIDSIIAKEDLAVNVISRSTNITTIKSAGKITLSTDNGINKAPLISNNDTTVADEYSKVDEQLVVQTEDSTPKSKTIKVEFEDCTDGIKGHIENIDGSSFKLDQGTWGKTGSFSEYCHFKFDGVLGYEITASGTDEFFYPFVDPGKEVKVEIEHYRETTDSEGNRIEQKLIGYGVGTVVPYSGKGKLSVSKGLKFEYSNDGSVTVSQMPNFANDIHDIQDMSVKFDFAKGKSWEEGAVWYGMIHNITKTGTYNIYTSEEEGWFSTTTGFDVGLISSLVELKYSYNGRVWNLRTDSGLICDDKKGLELLSRKEIRKKSLPVVKMVASNESNGIKVVFEESDGTPFIIENDPFVDERIEVSIDGSVVAHVHSAGGKTEFFYPFVEPNKTVNISAILYREENNKNGLRVQKYTLKELSGFDYKPTSGLGKVELTQKIEYTADNYGKVTITQVPKLSVPDVTEGEVNWNVMFGYGRGYDWTDGFWIGGTFVDSSELVAGVSKNFYDNNNQEINYGQVFIYPEISVTYTLNDKKYEYKVYDEKINVYTKNLKLSRQ
ncbi:hypothetical protein [Treponema sp.]|uniref:hypothetical protein n=1 Tax=Treponema sp. TaxID=166 RepID=UPI00298DC258|nr:hypothetical protein [Treponema sp.]MCQ2241261.1 hypothetical protein [Treponema sp.]